MELHRQSYINQISFGGPQLRRRETQSFACGGVLFLWQDPERFKQQLSSGPEQVEGDFKESLLNDVSTDQIIPVADLLTKHPTILGYRALSGLPPEYGIEPGTLKSSEATVLVAGERFGRGSSREQAVWALKEAGISAVLARSFGPIFEKNAAHLGLLTSTNVDLAPRIQAGEAVPFEEFWQGKDPLLEQIIKAGGLFRYLQLVKTGRIPGPNIQTDKHPERGMNIWEKRLAEAFGVPSVCHGDVGLLRVDAAYSYVGLSGLARRAMIEAYGKPRLGLNPNSVYFFEDHFNYYGREEIPTLTAGQREFAKELGIRPTNYYYGSWERGGGAGICHRVMLDTLDPRQIRVVVATDSHTPTLGSLPFLPIPVGSTLFAAALAEGTIPQVVYPVMRVELIGSLPPGFSIRDAQLEMAATVEPVQSGLVVEFGGDGLNNLSMDQVAALCNMVPEVFNGITAVTEAFSDGVDYLKARWGIPEKQAYKLYGMPDEDCQYEQIVTFDLSSVSPWIALPGSPNNAVSLSALEQHPSIDKAFLVSCTLGLGDLKEAAAVLKGKRVADNVELIIIPSSQRVRQQAEEAGIMAIFRQAGAHIEDSSSCGACIGEGYGSVAENEVAITASNRNFPGRMGAKTASVYMAGPLLTALAAVSGRIPTAEEYRRELPRIVENLKLLNQPSRLS